MAESYVRNSSGFQQANQIFVNVSGTYQEVNEAYANVGGTFQLVFSAFEATSFVTLSTGSGTFVAPSNSNAIHIQAAVGGGGGAVGGADYDKAGGESAGAGGGSAGYVSDKIFSISHSSNFSYTSLIICFSLYNLIISSASSLNFSNTFAATISAFSFSLKIWNLCLSNDP